MRLVLLMRLWLAALAGLAGARAAESGAPPPATPHPLAWDALEKTLEAKPGDDVADFEFSVRNTSGSPVEILDLQPSCGCTVAELPKSPWVLAPGETGSFKASADFSGKHGRFSKSIQVVTSAGPQVLQVHVIIPENDAARRARNLQLATADRQAVFRGDCASCHATPAAGRQGAELYAAACGICHAAEPRASMVPDLGIARAPRDAAYWRQWINAGREQTLMPAFAAEHGGPLTPAQIESLVAFALRHFPTEPTAP